MTNTNASPAPTEREYCTSERVAKQMLLLIADHPGTIGPLRCARIVGGFVVPAVSEEQRGLLDRYAIADLGWTLRTLKDLIEALERGGLVARSVGQRPTLSLTRAGHRALETLELEEGTRRC